MMERKAAVRDFLEVGYFAAVGDDIPSVHQRHPDERAQCIAVTLERAAHKLTVHELCLLTQILEKGKGESK